MGTMINRRRACGGKKLLPAGYTQLEYIENNGYACINTGVVLDFTETIDIGFELKTFSAYRWIFGNYASENHDCTRLILGSDYNAKCYANYNSKSGGGSIFISQPFVYNTKYDVSLMPNNSVLVNDVFYSKERVSGEPYNDAIFIFGRKNGEQPFSGRIFYFRIEGKRNYIPCINPQNVVGMYDTVEGKFYSSPNGTAFVAGPEV